MARETWRLPTDFSKRLLRVPCDEDAMRQTRAHYGGFTFYAVMHAGAFSFNTQSRCVIWLWNDVTKLSSYPMNSSGVYRRKFLHGWLETPITFEKSILKEIYPLPMFSQYLVSLNKSHYETKRVCCQMLTLTLSGHRRGMHKKWGDFFSVVQTLSRHDTGPWLYLYVYLSWLCLFLSLRVSATQRKREMFCEGLHCFRPEKQTVSFLMRGKLQRCVIAALEPAAAHSAVPRGGGGQTRQRFPSEWAEETLKYWVNAEDIYESPLDVCNGQSERSRVWWMWNQSE